jgi:hypothetical protein
MKIHHRLYKWVFILQEWPEINSRLLLWRNYKANKSFAMLNSRKVQLPDCGNIGCEADDERLCQRGVWVLGRDV